jgi:hypothetical protein
LFYVRNAVAILPNTFIADKIIDELFPGHSRKSIQNLDLNKYFTSDKNTVATKSSATFGFFHKDPMLKEFRAVSFFGRKE